MLVNDASEFVNNVGKSQRLRETVEERQAFVARNQDLQDLVSKIRPHVDALVAFRSKGVATPNMNERIASVVLEIDTIRDRFNSDPGWIVDNARFKYSPFQKMVERLAEEFDAHVRQCWTDFTNSRSRDVDRDVLTVLALVPSFQSAVSRIRKAQEKLLRAKSWVPTGESDIRKFEMLLSELNGAWAELGSDEVPSEVLEFLRTAGQDGAPIDLLTDVVRNWLGERGILRSLKVRIS